MTTLSTIRTRARQQADMENSQFISDTELNYMINSSYHELYELVVGLYEDYFVTSTTFSLTSGDAGVYSLPATFYKLKGVDYLEGSDYITIYPFNWNNRNQRRRAMRSGWTNRSELGYRLVGANLHIEPDDDAVGSYKLWYIPSITELSADGDTIDTVLTRTGWDEYIVVDAARKMLLKEESNTNALDAAKANIIRRITNAATNRDADQPMNIGDVRTRHAWESDIK